ncbi:TRAP transporter large permease [Oceanobacillus polygoni]|uniref:Tripartite ATP-independent transporter DctM subunit n=1 Tax=Oceanobacillus polygoni TaxID=1235259 RepID=A0A9X0YRA7_9BACI|nr:TRAP transporter large permease [Oceanobacillus polygoni]MBP2075824.1 tripartite ATP-independent transporter DctM subunit [Oceanobacillus polygoni]
MALTIMMISLLVLIFINVPVAFSIIASVAIYFIFANDFEGMVLIQRMISGLESVPLMAIIFFMASGILMNYTGITKRLLNFAEIITRPLPGALGQVNVTLSVLMSGLSGSNIADASMQSKMLVPSMEKKGYDRAFSTALTATSSIITPIIPPGIALIMFGYVGNVSIGDLFMAGILPGITLAILLMIYVYFYAKKHNLETEKKAKATAKEFFSGLKDAILALFFPIIIIGGIRFGIFSATEAGAIAVLYALVIGLIVYREMSLKDLIKSIVETVHTGAGILLIIAAGTAFGWVLTLEQVPQMMAESITGLISTPALFFIMILLFLLIIGMFVEGNVAIIILTPLFLPMLGEYGIDPVHFGIFFILTLSIGTITPPVGTIMFVTSSITGTKIEDFIKASIPFIILLIIASLLIAFIPQISMFLPTIFE